jgi:hypothetical protein
MNVRISELLRKGIRKEKAVSTECYTCRITCLHSFRSCSHYVKFVKDFGLPNTFNHMES